jgi:hypothetical protein
MTTLIERLEAAGEGSRELDAEVRFVTVGDMTRCNFDEGSYCADCRETACGKWLGIHDKRTSYPRDWRDDERLPAYTSRRDDLTAAMTLVPEGWRIIRVEFSASGHRTYMHLSKIGTLDAVLGIGSSMSLALTAAALRAEEIEDEQW